MKSGKGEGKVRDCLSKETGAGANSLDYVKSLLTKCRNFVLFLPKQLAITEACWTTHPQSSAGSHLDHPAARQRSRLLTGRSPEQPRAPADPFPPAFHARTAAPSAHRGFRGDAPSASGLDTGVSRFSPAAPRSRAPRAPASLRRRLGSDARTRTSHPAPLDPSLVPEPPPGTRPPHAARIGALPVAPPTRVPRNPGPGSRKPPGQTQGRGPAGRTAPAEGLQHPVARRVFLGKPLLRHSFHSS